MVKIMFVCHGNICRSPMAEFVLKDMVKKEGREKDFVIASCATSTEEILGDRGNPVYPPAKAELKKHGISCDGKFAVQLKKTDYDKYDLFFCMDDNNVKNAMKILGKDDEGKVQKLLSDRDVADPWYTRNFEITYEDIYKGCKTIVEKY